MRTRKHAVVVVMPRMGATRTLQDRFFDNMQQMLHEYICVAERMQPSTKETNERLGTRILLSVNVVGVGASSGGIGVGVNRPVLITSAGGAVQPQISQFLDDQIARWRRLEESNGGAQHDQRARELSALRAALVDESFDISVITLADVMPVINSNEDMATGASFQLVLVRDDEEEPEHAAHNVLVLARKVKAGGRWSISQADNCRLELARFVKEWLYMAAPCVTAALIVSSASTEMNPDDNQRIIGHIDLRSAFALVPRRADDTSSSTQLHAQQDELRVLHFIKLGQIPAHFLCGCIFQASPSADSQDMRALVRRLEDDGLGAVVVCDRMSPREYYLLVAEERSNAMFLHRLPAAEEVLLKPKTDATSITSDEEAIEANSRVVESIPCQDYNPFKYRLGTPWTRTASAKQAASAEVSSHSKSKSNRPKKKRPESFGVPTSRRRMRL
ncbi:hypothetical protein PINS_up012655 [Pythium insidiosum]|nr:hypothetical protein PINS_up012655 [Pythium insidiosum]